MVRVPFGTRLLRAALGATFLSAATAGAALAQGAVISGTVTAEGQNNALPASVTIQQLGLAVQASEQGRYTIQVPGAQVLNQQVRIVARYIGYEPLTKTITISAGAQTVDFSLKFDPFRLSDVVVTGTSDGQSRNKIPFSVAVVNEEQLKEVPASSPVAALAGKVAGARIAIGTGNPGSAPAIRLRGSTNLGVGGSSPLIIIDGVITRFSIADIDAQDIASIEVLKGAAASAFYGSDAANGVLAITTKRGQDIREGTVRMSVRSEIGNTSLGRWVPLNQSHQYLTNADGSITTNAAGTRQLDPDNLMDNPYPSSGDMRWRNQLKEWITGGEFYSNNFQLGFRRGGTNLNTSFTSDHNGGILPFRSGQFRQSARVNVDQQINSKADFGVSATYSLSNNDFDPGSSAGWFALLQSPPDVNLERPNGAADPVDYFPVLPAFASNSRGNPLYELANNSYSLRRERILGSATLRYRPVEWLRLEGSYGTDRSNRRSQNYQFVGYYTGQGIPGNGALNINYAGDVAENLQANAIATKLFGELLSTTRATYLVEKQTNASLGASGNLLTVPGVIDLDAVPNENNSIGSGTQQRNTINYFLSQAFDWRDKYILDLLVRRDGSSLFGADNRWANFYRVAGAWRFTEDFEIPGVQEGRVRFARGTAGLRPGFADQYENYALSNGQVTKNQLGNPTLTPAIQTENEYGFNLTFLDKFDAELVYAARVTEGAFLSVPLSPAVGDGAVNIGSGYTFAVQNAADVSAQTLEFSLGARLVDGPDFSYAVNFVADRTRQKIDRMGRAPFRVNAGGQGQDVFYYREGETLGVIYGQRWVRNLDELADMGRDPALHSINSEGYAVLTSQLGTAAERPIAFIDLANFNNTTFQIGDVNPDFSWGFTQTARWRGFQVYALIDGVKGGDIYNFTKQWMYQDFRHGSVDQRGKTGADARPYQFHSAGLYNGLVANSHFVEDGTYARLRELSVSYNFDPGLLSRVGLGALSQGMKLSIVGRNLLTWTNYSGFDPEANSGNDFNFRIDGFRYPNFRTVTAMIDVSF